MPDTHIVIVFPTTHLTLSAEKSLEKAGIGHRTIMKPRRISSDCGLAIRIEAGLRESSRRALKSEGVLPARFYAEEDGKWVCVDEVMRTPEGGS